MPFVGTEGQILISRDIRERLGVQPGWLALERLVDDHVELYFVPPEHRRSLAGILRPLIDAAHLADESWDVIREVAWAAAARESADRPDGER